MTATTQALGKATRGESRNVVGLAARRGAAWYRPSPGFCTVLMALVLLSSLTNTDERLQPVGKFALVLLLAASTAVTMVFLGAKARLPSRLKPVLAIAALFLLLHLPLLPDREFGTRGAIVCLQWCLVVGFFTSLSLWHWDSRSLGWLAPLPAAYVVSTVGYWVYCGLPVHFSSYFHNPNSLGGFLFCMLLYLSAARVFAAGGAQRRAATLAVALVLLGLFATRSRATWVAAAAMGVTYYAWPTLASRRWMFHGWLLGLFLAMGAFMWVYSRNEDVLMLAQLDDISANYTGKQFTSGRDWLWDILLEAAADRPWTGRGAGFEACDASGVSFSAHNLYLQVALQSGLAGLGLLLLLLWQVWSMFWTGRRSAVVRLCGSFVIGFIAFQMFEVSLTQNYLAAGLTCWLAMAVGASGCRQDPWQARRTAEATAQSAPGPHHSPFRHRDNGWRRSQTWS